MEAHSSALWLVAIILFAGILAQIVAYKLRLPAIVPLLLFGAALGQSGLLRPGVLGGSLQTIVQIGVAIILFEGGLSLKARHFREAPSIIRNLTTVGVLITWVTVTAMTYWLIPDLRSRQGFHIALLFGALMTVSGPTVVMPLLKIVKPKRTLATILRWEAVLVDPIGALLAVLVLTFIETSASQGFLLREFLRSLSIALAFGGVGALVLNKLLRTRDLFSNELRNLIVLSFVILIFALSDWVQRETGILSVTVAGFALGLLNPPGLREIESFKGQLTILLVSILFILLAANLDFDAMWALGSRGLLLLAAILFLIRPLNVLVSGIGSALTLRDKLFLSWIAPRGIVAAAVASLFSETLSHTTGYAVHAGYIESLTFLVIAGTVFFQGATARYVGKWLGVLMPEPNGVVFVGANAAARHLAEAIQHNGIEVLMLDTNPNFVSAAHKEGLPAVSANAISPDTLEEMDLTGFGQLLAMTPNEKVNILACQLWSHEFGRDRVFRVWLDEKADEPPEELGLAGEGHLVFPEEITLEWLQHHLERSWTIRSREIRDNEEFQEMYERVRIKEIFPLAFIRENKLTFFEEDRELPRSGIWIFLEKESNGGSKHGRSEKNRRERGK